MEQESPPGQLRVLVFARYMRGHNRNQVVFEGFRSRSIRWREIYPESIAAIPVAFLRALREPFDVLYVPFGGSPFVVPGKLLSFLRRKPLVFDLLISGVDSEVEYGMVREGSPAFWFKYLRERFFCLLPDVLLTESGPQMEYLSRYLRIPLRKFRVVPVGALPPGPASGGRREGTTVLFYGFVRKATGFEHVARAASLLQHRPDIRFVLYGKNRYYEWVREEWQPKLPNARFAPAVPYSALDAEIARADICLGLFGDHPKAARAIPNKVLECMARGKAVVSRPTPAGEGLLEHGRDIWFVPPASPEALAQAVEHLADHPEERERLGRAAREVYQRQFTPERVGERLREIFLESPRVRGGGAQSR